MQSILFRLLSMQVLFKLFKVSLLLAIFLFTNSVFANHEGYDRNSDRSSKSYRPLSFYFGAGFGGGGDEVGEFVDGFGRSETVRAGGGGFIEGGGLLTVAPSTGLRLTVGYQADGASRFNGSSRFERVRFDLTFIRAFGRHELGAGITGQVEVGFRCDIRAICAEDTDFDNAAGFTLEYAYNLGNRFYRRGRARGSLSGVRVGLRFTDIEYTPEFEDTLNSDDVDGNTLAAFIGISF